MKLCVGNLLQLPLRVISFLFMNVLLYVRLLVEDTLYIRTYVSTRVGFVRNKIFHNDYTPRDTCVRRGYIDWDAGACRFANKRSACVVRESIFLNVLNVRGMGIKIDDTYDLVCLSDLLGPFVSADASVSYSNVVWVSSWPMMAVFGALFFTRMRTFSVFLNALGLPSAFTGGLVRKADAISVIPVAGETGVYVMYGVNIKYDEYVYLGRIVLSEECDRTRATNESVYFQHVPFDASAEYLFRVDTGTIGSGYFASRVGETYPDVNVAHIADVADWRTRSRLRKRAGSWMMRTGYRVAAVLNGVSAVVRSVALVFAIKQKWSECSTS